MRPSAWQRIDAGERVQLDGKTSALDGDLRRIDLAHPQVSGNLVGARHGFVWQGDVQECLVGAVAGLRPCARDPEILAPRCGRGRRTGGLQAIGSG